MAISFRMAVVLGMGYGYLTVIRQFLEIEFG
jgi:hypothetical protein